jgi:hypothetical protein
MERPEDGYQTIPWPVIGVEVRKNLNKKIENK